MTARIYRLAAARPPAREPVPTPEPVSSVPHIPLHRMANATKDWSAIGSYRRDAIETGEWLRSRITEPDKSEYRYLLIGALTALVWIAIFAVAKAGVL